MRYMCFVKMREDVGDAPAALYTAMDEEMTTGFSSGLLVDAGGLSNTADSTQIELRAGDVITTNGPWAEAKEVAGGYSIIEVRTHEEAIESARRIVELHKQHWPGWEGSVEIRRISGGADS